MAEFELADLGIPEDSEFQRLLEICPDIEKRCFRDGEYLMREGEECSDVFLVVKGSYVVEQAGEENEAEDDNKALAIVSSWPARPSFAGEMAYLGDGIRTASVRSSLTTYALCLQPKHLDVIIDRFPFFTRILCQQSTARLKGTNVALRESFEQFHMNTEQIFVRTGEVVFKEGEYADTLFQLVDGVLTRTEGDKEEQLTPQSLFLGFVEPGPYFAGAMYQVTVKAETPAIVVSIDSASRLAVVRNYPELLVQLYSEAVVDL